MAAVCGYFALLSIKKMPSAAAYLQITRTVCHRETEFSPIDTVFTPVHIVNALCLNIEKRAFQLPPPPPILPVSSLAAFHMFRICLQKATLKTWSEVGVGMRMEVLHTMRSFANKAISLLKVSATTLKTYVR